MTDLLSYAADWVDESRAALGDRGVEFGLSRSPADRENPSLWIDVDGSDRMVRVTLWASGEAVLAAADGTTGSILLEEQLTLADTAAVEETLRRAVTLASGGSPS
ncbi:MULTISPECIES: immunity protein TriTu family protein [Kribbella]|uniref:Immunity protein 53 of polymorphic toxin system n=1 Tax=Kribbella karoonensis TaxID=324851 RepID=A0ABN2EGZ2_9ACTN